MDGKIKSMFDAEPHRQHLCDAIFPNDDRHDDADDGAVVAAYIILPTPRPWLEECEKQPAKKTKKGSQHSRKQESGEIIFSLN